MKLISCHVANFGKLQAFDYSFDEDISIIHEDNGWGKSTLATFIRVMFFGFRGESKRNILENERKRYKPWQMGPYGGNVVFSANGKKYRLERRFGEKKSGSDVFALYDNATNLKSNDYSSNIGEELFGINIESFMKTVFIAQQDCSTEVTPDISAKIGNISDQTADMGNYDSVQSALKKEMDRLTPDRSTGFLKKTEMRMSELKENVRLKDNIIYYLNESSKSLEERVNEKENLLKEQRDVQKELERVSAIKDSQAGAEKYKELCDQVSIAKVKYDEARSFFPNDVPTKDEIEVILKKCDELENAQQTVIFYSLSDDEKKKLDSYEEIFKLGLPDENSLNNLEENIETLSNLESERNNSQLSEAERRKLNDAMILFKNYKPTLDEIEWMSAKWEERRSKKEALSTKKANAEFIKNANAVNSNSRNSINIVGLLLIILGILAVLGGVAATAIAKEITTGAAIIAGIGFILSVIGSVLFARRSMAKTDSSENTAYTLMLDEIGRDEDFISNVEQSCKGLFYKLGLNYGEYDASVELNRIRSLIKEYDELVERYQKGNSSEREANIRSLTDSITEYLQNYRQGTFTADYKKALYNLKSDVADYSRIKNKKEKIYGASQKRSAIGNEIKDYLRSLGFEAEDIPKRQLLNINEKRMNLDHLSEDLTNITQRKENFEKENDVSKFNSKDESSENASLEDLNRSFNNLGDQIDNITKNENDIQKQIDLVNQKLEEIENDESELADLQEKYEIAKRKYAIIAKTRDYLEKAKQNFSSKYMDGIQTSFEKYHDIISPSNDKYELDANLNIQLKEKGTLHEIDYLSEGYKDLVGLCRRMAMVDAMYELEKPFLIFDDPFVNLDDVRLSGAMKFLDDLAKEYQIIYFTCHKSRCDN